MMWELLALWAIVLGTLVWFIRDERQKRGAPSAPVGKAVRSGSLPMIARTDPARAAESRRRFIEAMVARKD